MQNHIKERFLGSAILLGGGILLSAMLFRGEGTLSTADSTSADDSVVVVSKDQIKENSKSSVYDNLTADYETEQRILAKKREQRSKQVAEREAEISELLKQQTKARAKALEKAKKENKKVEEIGLELDASANNKNSKKLRDEAKAAAAKLKKLQAEQFEIQQRKIKREQLQAEKRAIEERKRIEAMKAKRAEESLAKEKKQDAKQSYIEANNKLKNARKKADGSADQYAVQVALASSQENADALVNKLKKHGYKVTTSNTSRGIRVVVGPEKGQKTAYALRDKLHSDSRINVNGAWVAKYDRVSQKKPSTNKHSTSASKSAKQQETEVLAKRDGNKKKDDKKKESSKKNSDDSIETLIAQKDFPKAEDKYNYGVQVAMAGDAKNRDALIAKLEKNGYKVKTSHTSRGTRIIVGGGMNKADAKKLQAKVNSDKRVGISGAWLKREKK